MLILLPIISNLIFLLRINCHDFGYEGDEGPDYWGKKFPKCIGQRQSPIDINTENVVTKKFRKLILKNFNRQLRDVLVENNGHTVQLTILSGPKPILKGGPVKGKFEFAQMHYHWGQNNTVGSENQLNHETFSGEIHLVFFRKLYKNIKTAVDRPSGLTVLAFFIKAYEMQDNESYQKLENALKNIINTSTTTTIKKLDSLDSLIVPHGERKLYYSFDGSLTTPPCNEVVNWIEFKTRVPISNKQINAFRQIYSHQEPLTHNYRPVQPLNGRIVYYNADKKLRSRSVEGNRYNGAEKAKFSMLYFKFCIIYQLLIYKI